MASAVAWIFAADAHAAGQFLEDIRVSRVGDEATIEIDLGCPMRLQADASVDGGAAIELHVAPLEACRQLGVDSAFASERSRPVGGQLAELVEVEYESLGLGDSILSLRFARTVAYEVAQRGGLRSLQLIIHTDQAPRPTRPPATRATPEERPAATTERRLAPPEPAREPLQARVRAPSSSADFIVNLQSTRDPRELAAVGDAELGPGHLLYVSQTELGGEVWYRLRVGFFESETAAREFSAALAARFPRAWIGRAEPSEVASAAEVELERGEFFVETDAAPSVAATATTAQGPREALPPERIVALMDEAREAIIAEDYATAVRNYTRVLQEPGDHRAEAREYLGVARERMGQLAQARAEYQAYLEEFDAPADQRRVAQRLNGLAALATAPRTTLRSEQIRDRQAWTFSSGFAQYYRRHVNQFDADQPEVVTFSALVTDADFSVRRSGESVDLTGRVALSHFYDLLEEPTSSAAADPTRVSYAYLDVDAAQGTWAVRTGRQSLHNWGVLGRFDGLHFSYDWNEGRRVHYQLGYPVESTRHSLQTTRQFQGVAVEFEDLIGRWDIGAYLNQQTIEHVDDRQAVGIEVRYVDDQRSMTSMVDYDVLYGELNTALMLGTWRFPNRLTLSALYDSRKSPFLTTRNSLIGQPVGTIEEMLLVWSVEELEQLALDRTAQSVTTTLGLSKPIGERLQLSADLTSSEIDGTVGSAGVSSIPATGTQTYVSTTLVGTGIFGSGDVTIVSLRRGTADSFDLSQLTWDARFPVGRKLRLNPRLRYAVWESLDGGGRRDTLGVSFRLLLSMRNHYRLELELGADQIERTNSSATQIGSGKFFNLGYRADF